MTLATREIGRTGLKVPVLGLGGAPLGNLYDVIPEPQALATVEAAWQAGALLFDTAPLYGHGLSEHRFGHVLRQRPRDSYVLCTKVGRVLKPADPATLDRGQWAGPLNMSWRFDYSYDGVMRSVEDSFQRLGIERIDVLFVHDLDANWAPDPKDFEARYGQLMKSGWKALSELRAAGTVKALGLGVNHVAPCVRFAKEADPDLYLLAGRYTLLEQAGLDELFPLARQKGFSFLMGGPFNSGILATGPVPGAKYNYKPAPPDVLDRVGRIEKVCEAHKVPLAAAAIQFPLGEPSITAIVPGAVRPEEVTRNVALMTHKIPAGLWADLKAEGLLAKDAPVPG